MGCCWSAPVATDDIILMGLSVSHEGDGVVAAPAAATNKPIDYFNSIIKQAQKILIPDGTLPVYCIGSQTIPFLEHCYIIIEEMHSSIQIPVAAAGFCNNSRAIVFGSSQIVQANCDSNKQLLKNALNFITKDIKDYNIRVMSNDLATYKSLIESVGYQVEAQNQDISQYTSYFILTSFIKTSDNITQLQDMVNKGVGIIILFDGGEIDLINELLSRFCLALGKRKSEYTRKYTPRQYHQLVKKTLPKLIDTMNSNISLKEFDETALLMKDILPYTQTVFPQLQSFAREKEIKIGNTDVKASTILDLLVTSAQTSIDNEFNPEEYGEKLPKVVSPTSRQTVSIKRTGGWISTGLYLPPCVKTALLSSSDCIVQVGCLSLPTPQLPLSRLPEQSKCVRLKANLESTLFSHFGGPLYVIDPSSESMTLEASAVVTDGPISDLELAHVALSAPTERLLSVNKETLDELFGRIDSLLPGGPKARIVLDDGPIPFTGKYPIAVPSAEWESAVGTIPSKANALLLSAAALSRLPPLIGGASERIADGVVRFIVAPNSRGLTAEDLRTLLDDIRNAECEEDSLMVFAEGVRSGRFNSIGWSDIV